MRAEVTIPQAMVDAVARRVVELLDERHCEATNEQPLLNVDAAATYLAAKPKRVYDLVQAGRLPVHRDGRRLLFRREDLEHYVASFAEMTDGSTMLGSSK